MFGSTKILNPRYYLTKKKKIKCRIIKDKFDSFSQKIQSIQKKRKQLVDKKQEKGCKSADKDKPSLFTTIQRLNKLLTMYDSDYKNKCTFNKYDSNLSNEILTFSQCFNDYYDANYDDYYNPNDKYDDDE